MRKISRSLVLCLAIILSLGTTVFANDISSQRLSNEKEMTEELLKQIKVDEKNEKLNNYKILNKKVVNEYEMFKELDKKSDNELEKLGLNKDQIKEFRKIDYKAKLKKLKSKNRNELKSLGYSDERINAIYAYDETEASIKTASASITTGIAILEHQYHSTFTRFRTRFSWEWSDTPFFTYYDIVGVSVSEDMYFEDNSYSYHAVNYYDLMTGSYETTQYLDYTPVSTTGAIKSVYDANISINGDAKIAMRGNAYASFTKMEYLPEVSALAKHGHSTVSIIPSMVLSGSGIAFSFTPSLTVESLQEYIYSTM